MPPATKKYIRNTRYVQVGVRLGSGRKINLLPRGMRGDCVPVSKEEMGDEIFLANVGNLYEVITATEAENVIEKQTTNQQAQHPTLQSLRSATGDSYTGVVVSEIIEAEGQKVAVVTDRGNIQRFDAVGSTTNPLPDAQNMSEEEKRDEAVRNAKVEGPEAGLAGLKVSLDNPTKTN